MPRLKRQDIFDDKALAGGAFCRAYAKRVDDWLAELFNDIGPARRGVALVAVGGYGRSELCPQSDLDVILLHERGVDITSFAERLWYPIWDEGVKLGHAVFTGREALKLAESDLDTATTLVEARLLAGDGKLQQDLADRARNQWVRSAPRWLPQLREALNARTESPGEVAYMLEPDLKLGRGGLRDAHVLRWLAVAHDGLLGRDQDAHDHAYEQLLAARVALHRRTGRRGDRLLLQEQDAVASDLGFGDADELMAAVASAARTIEWLTDDAFDRVSVTSGWLHRRPRERSLAPGILLRDGQVQVEEPIPSGVEGCLLLFEAALAAVRNDLRLSRDALERFAASSLTFPNPWPAELRDALVALLGAGPRAIPTLELIAHWGLLSRAIPEWEPCRSRPQRNAYHRYTVDRHLLEAAANAAGLASRVERGDLLIMGALLHDIGKGYPPRDHTEVGCELVAALAPRLGFPPEDVDVLVDLVRLHLLLPDVATRRDLGDPGTLRSVAADVGTEARLRLLHGLTEADSIATGPAAWGDWKAGLVAELVERTSHLLAGGDPSTVSEVFPTEAHRELMGLGRRVIVAAGKTVTVVDRDRPGLFSRVAGVLALNGLDVLAANAYSATGGVALCEFTVLHTVAGPVGWDKVRSDIERSLRGQLAVRARLAERARVYSGHRPSKQAPAPWDRAATDRSIDIDNDMSSEATVIEVRAPDALGLLYQITSAMAELDLDLRSAKIQTLGDHVVDAFYVCDSTGAKITEDVYLKEIKSAVLFALGQ